MIAVRNYLMFILFILGMTLSVNASFSENEIAQILNHVFELHNDAREKHGVQPLIRTDKLDVEAFNIFESIGHQNLNPPDTYGINICTKLYNTKNKDIISLARESFLEWYNCNKYYCYFFEPLKKDPVVDQFTSIVWSNTKWIGMTFRHRLDTYTVVVIYDPPGNIKGQYTSNVMIPPSLAVARNPKNNMLLYQGDCDRFLNYIFELHNLARQNHGVQILEYDEYVASKVYNLIFTSSPETPINYGMNIIERRLHKDFKMDAVEAEAIFTIWCNDAASFTNIVWTGATKFGIKMVMFTKYYKIIALYGPPRTDRRKFIDLNRLPQYMEQGESSDNH